MENCSTKTFFNSSRSVTSGVFHMLASLEGLFYFRTGIGVILEVQTLSILVELQVSIGSIGVVENIPIAIAES